MRQVANPDGNLILAQAYDPYGNLTMSVGTAQTSYGFTAEQTDPTGMIYLRARHYSPQLGRFMTRHTWGGDANMPMSYNRWNYTSGNPVNYIDPTGNSICYGANPVPAACIAAMEQFHTQAEWIRFAVKSGASPVEMFAFFADSVQNKFNQLHLTDSSSCECKRGSISDIVWAMTRILNGVNANNGPISLQIVSEKYTPVEKDGYYIGADWLPYRNNSTYDKNPWCYIGIRSRRGSLNETYKECDGKQIWIHSLRGDWSEKYWDKTANQAYHFWGLLAITFFDGRAMGNLANLQHDGSWASMAPSNYDYSHSDPNKAPHFHGVTKPDWDLSVRAIELGDKLSLEALVQSPPFDSCSIESAPNFPGYTDIGGWIRSNLK